MYCTTSDVEYAIAPSGNQQGTAYGATPEAYNDAISEAMGTINAYVARRYLIIEAEVEAGPPIVTAAPSPIRLWTRDVAAYLLTLTYKRNVNMDENDPIRLRYQHVMSQLRDVRSGFLDLDLPSATTDDSGIGVYNRYQGDLFGPDEFDLTTAKPNTIGYGSNG